MATLKADSVGKLMKNCKMAYEPSEEQARARLLDGRMLIVLSGKSTAGSPEFFRLRCASPCGRTYGTKRQDLECVSPGIPA